MLYSFLLQSKVIQYTFFSILPSMMVYDRCWTGIPALNIRTLFIRSVCNKNSVHFWSFEVLQRLFPPGSSVLFNFVLFHPILPTLSEDLLCADPCVCLPVFLSPPQWYSIEGSWRVRTSCSHCSSCLTLSPPSPDSPRRSGPSEPSFAHLSTLSGQCLSALVLSQADSHHQTACSWLLHYLFHPDHLADWYWNENRPFPVLWPLLSFSNLLAYWVQHFHSIIF